MREQSFAHFAPWNPFFYEIGFPFFGFNPAGHYAHMLLVLWLISVATFFLLRLWLTSLSALMGAVLFLAMPATGAVGQMLMTGHYAYGLFFSVLAIYFFVRGIRESKFCFSLLAAGLYAMACWSKELYVPIIGILVFLPESNWKVRLRHSWPTILVAFVYTVYRLVVLHGIGGYGGYSLMDIFAVSIDIIVSLFSNLLGSGWSGKLIAAYIGISIFMAVIFYKRHINLIFLLGGFVVITIPIIPVLHISFGYENLRFLFFMSWALAILLAWITNLSKLSTMTLVIVAIALISSQQRVIAGIVTHEKIMEEQHRFLIEERGKYFIAI